ncbi:MAG: hypothetical protein JWO90_1431 [Solirubrobacterales bacterium]|nr:hypothetical protein [Solirubrobacterales bacterium]
MHAIVADADEGRRAALRAELERHGHQVLVAADVETVLQEGRRNQPLVVLGAEVEDGDGVALCRDLTMVPGGDGPVVVLVGYPGDVDVDAALSAGAADVWVLDVGGETISAVEVRVALARYYARLQAENLRVGGEFALMRQALDLSGTGFVLTDPRLEDNPIVYANRSFLEMTGYPEAEVIGRNCRFLQGESTDRDQVARIAAAIREGRPASVEFVNHRKDGTPFFNELHIAPIRDERGEVIRHVGVQLDVTAYRVRDQLFALEQRARQAAEAAERRSSFLAAASPALDARLDLRSTLESLARLSVPHLGDVCLVETVRSGEAHRVALSAVDDALERKLLALPSTSPLTPDAETALARVLRQGRAEVVDGRGGPVVGDAVDETLREHDGRSGRRWMLVPLRARGRSIGVLALASLAEDRRYGIDELALAQDLAGRAALALDNARLYEQQVEVARVLQASFLPDRLPEVEGLELVTRYRPADAAIDIGGDFYDVLALDSGKTALAVGDVAGKGAPAAALTGLCRHTLRTAWTYEQEPAKVLEVLNRMLLSERRDRGRYATVVLATFAPGPDGIETEVVCAGHPAPRVLRASGEVDVLGERGTILGWRDDIELRPVDGVLRSGDTLVTFTDGVSAGDEGGPLSEEALHRELERCAGRDVDEIAARLQAAAVRAQVGRPSDDVVIVAARAV